MDDMILRANWCEKHKTYFIDYCEFCEADRDPYLLFFSYNTMFIYN